jgi:hypothetical protein
MLPPDERTLDWRPNPRHWALGSARYLLAAMPACSSLSARSQIMRRRTVFLDQGVEGACTGYGEEHVQALSPHPQWTSNEMARAVYHEARRQDEWPGEDYEGSSVNGAMRAARQMNRIKSWYWARTMEEARHGVSYHGAGELGIWWYSGMWDTDADGFVSATGELVGGHALAYAGYRLRDGRREHRLENSWGPEWGDHGGCWISEEDLASLLNADGELAFPVKVRA